MNKMGKAKLFLNSILWGFILWLFGYLLGIVFFFFVPKEAIGWLILPFGVIATLWILFKQIKRELFSDYIVVGVIWAIMAVALDYGLLVRMFDATDYYKLDVYLYYTLTFLLPIIVGWYKLYRANDITHN
jgi:hypothetical protein